MNVAESSTTEKKAVLEDLKDQGVRIEKRGRKTGIRGVVRDFGVRAGYGYETVVLEQDKRKPSIRISDIQCIEENPEIGKKIKETDQDGEASEERERTREEELQQKKEKAEEIKEKCRNGSISESEAADRIADLYF